MSGLSLAVGPRSDPDATAFPSPSALAPKRREPAVMGGVMGSLRVIELQLVAFIMVFSASGLVPVVDIIFPAFATAYTLVLSRFAFPSPGGSSGGADGGGRELFENSRAFRTYVVVGTTVGLFMPLAYVLGGFARGDDHAVRSATPHLFLLSCQILTENVVHGLGVFSAPVKAMVPLLYTVRRVFVIADWIYDVSFNRKLPANASVNDEAWLWFGRSLAMANLLYFSVNLFGFLIPRFLPKAFEKYFKERNEICAKMADDKQPTKELQSKKAD